MRNLIEKPKNPAKETLSAYRWALKRRDALLCEIEENYENAQRATSRMKAVMVSGTPSHDGMANAVLRAVDAKERLETAVEEVNKALEMVLEVIDGMEEGVKKTLLVMRYINGWTWEKIARELYYDRSRVFVIHGRALLDAEKIMDAKRQDEKRLF